MTTPTNPPQNQTTAKLPDSELPDLFPGFEYRMVSHAGLEFFARIGGSGPPLLCLHGYPQTHACWHRVAPELAKHFTVVAMDLRGYGQSSAPKGDTDHTMYAKRTMAQDAVGVMAALGFSRFSVMGHDRGARVAYRLALDVPDCVDRLILLDIIPTVEAFDAMRAPNAHKSYHWLFLAQPAPLPENLINANPEFYVDYTLGDWAGARKTDGLALLAPEAVAHYRSFMREPDRVHAICEDYRAGYFFDRPLDAADRETGHKILPPTLFLWGKNYLGGGQSDPLAIWQRWCETVSGQEIDSGHFLAEENPADVLRSVIPFLKAAS